MKRFAVLVLSLFTLFLPIFAIISNSPAYTASNLPISGTFIAPDWFYTTEEAYDESFKEMRNSGIDTVILTLITHLEKDCKTGQYNEQINYRLNNWNPQQIAMFIKMSKKYNMSIFFGVSDHRVAYENGQVCFLYFQGDVNDENTDKGRIIAFNRRTMEAIKSKVQELGFSWSDPAFKGFYITTEEDTAYFADPNSIRLQYYTDVSKAIKQFDPTKKILFSPFQYESTGYELSKTAFRNLFEKTSIDILAPQDSIGTGVTSSISKSEEHFKALGEVVKSYPNKQAWANIESFTQENKNDFIHLVATDINLLKQQVAAAQQPGISRLITYMYTHTMMMNAWSDDMASVSNNAPLYTPINAIKRAKLRKDYLSAYGALTWSITSTQFVNGSVSVTGNFGTSGQTQTVTLLYLNTANKLSRVQKTIRSFGQVSQTITFDPSETPYINMNMIPVAYVVDDYFLPYSSPASGKVSEVLPDGYVRGTTQDADVSKSTLHFYLDAPYDKGGKFIGTAQTVIVENQSTFQFRVPSRYLTDSSPHKVYAYIIGANRFGIPEANVLLSGSGSTIPAEAINRPEGDINTDGKVNANDYIQFKDEYEKEGPYKSDFNNDGVVNLYDYNLFVTYYGN